MELDLKRCPRCALDKERNAFGNNKRLKDGLHTWCRDCCSVYSAAKRAANPDYFRKISRDSRARCKARNPEKDKAYYQAWYRNNLSRIKSMALERQYGITMDDYVLLLASQGGKCAICRSAGTKRKASGRLAVDHDHVTGKVRGLLCHGCNTGLGKLEDSTEILSAAINYLRRHRQAA